MKCSTFLIHLLVLWHLFGPHDSWAQTLYFQTTSRLHPETFCEVLNGDFDKSEPTNYFTQYNRQPCACTSCDAQNLEETSLQGARASHTNGLKKVFEHPLLLTESDLSRGVVSAGEEDASQHRFLTKLLAGKS